MLTYAKRNGFSAFRKLRKGHQRGKRIVLVLVLEIAQRARSDWGLVVGSLFVTTCGRGVSTRSRTRTTTKTSTKAGTRCVLYPRSRRPMKLIANTKKISTPVPTCCQ